MPNIMHYDQEKDRLWFDHNKSNMCTPFSRGRNGASFTGLQRQVPGVAYRVSQVYGTLPGR